MIICYNYSLRGGVGLPRNRTKQAKAGSQVKAVAARGTNNPVPPIPRGRPRGKRSDPDFTPVYAYIRKSTHKEVKIKLIQQDNRDFSELLDELLSEWLKSNI